MENDHIEPTIESLVAEFNTLGEMLSEHHVLRCKPVARAKAKGKNGFEEFCAKAKLRPESSTTRKYLKIGLEADWLLPMAHQLPAEWTTIYDVAVLGQAKAEEMVRLGTLHPQVTRQGAEGGRKLRRFRRHRQRYERGRRDNRHNRAVRLSGGRIRSS